MIKIKKGLNLPLTGRPKQEISDKPTVKHVALLGPDYVGLKPTMLVKEGDSVQLGQPLFEDKKNPGIIFASPGAGKVTSINRGEKRAFESIVIALSGDAELTFEKFPSGGLTSLGREKAQDVLVKSGMWTSFRTRPFSKVPAPSASPKSIFVTATDTSPLAADPQVVIEENEEAFRQGVDVLTNLTEGKVFVCQDSGDRLPVSDSSKIQVESFSGPHPAGLAGTHIHYLDPAGPKHQVWWVGYQDVIAIGKLFTTGKLSVDRIFSLAGPQVNEPRLIRSRVGASLAELTEGQLKDGENRVISGSVLFGRSGADTTAYQGRYQVQVSVLREGRDREFLGWQAPGLNKFSLKRVYAGAALPGKQFAMTTNKNGSDRAMVPIGMYEAVMPLRMYPTQLLRALWSKDLDIAQSLGALELDEEDLGLCTFVCPGKTDWGPKLRDTLTTIEREG